MWMWCWRSPWAETRWYGTLHRDRQGCVELAQNYANNVQLRLCIFRSGHIRQSQELVPLQGRGLVLQLSGAKHELRCAKLLWSIWSLQQREVQVTEINSIATNNLFTFKVSVSWKFMWLYWQFYFLWCNFWHSCPKGFVKSAFGQRLGCNPIKSVDTCKRKSLVQLTGYDSVFDAYNPKPLKVSLSACKAQCLKDCKCDGFTYNAKTGLCYKTDRVLTLRKVSATTKLAFVKL